MRIHIKFSKCDRMTCPKVTIIILNWNGSTDTIECLESLRHITYPNYEILLVDNGSTDGSVERLKNLYPKIEIIVNGKNLGFAEGNNIAIKRAICKGTDYILLLNNDTVVESEFLGKLVLAAETNQKIGIVGPTVYHYNDPKEIQSNGGKINWYKGTVTNRTKIENDKIFNSRKVDFIMGCALLAKGKLFNEIGYLNKNYFAYWEETDWCVRAQRANYDIMYIPKSKIWHKGESSSKKISEFYEYHVTRNRFWFMKQNATNIQYFCFMIYYFGYLFWISCFAQIYHRNFKYFKRYLRGTLRGIKDGVCSFL